MIYLHIENQVSEERFKDFKDEVLRAINSLSKSIIELRGELRAYTAISQQQDREITLHRMEIDVINKAIEELRVKSDELQLKSENMQLKILELDTELKTTRRNTKNLIYTVGGILGIIQFIISVLPAIIK